MKSFSPSMLRARHAILSGVAGDASIEILLRPFLCEGEVIDTAIHLDGVKLPSIALKDLAGRSFPFPVNPSDGYIDGSICLDHAHHPVDITSLEFHDSRDGGVVLVVKGTYVFEFEGLNGCKNTPFTLGVSVSSRAV